jgi:hypothetical protein
LKYFSFQAKCIIIKDFKVFPTGFGAELPEESWLPKGGKLPVCKATGFKTELGRRGSPSLHPPVWVEKKEKGERHDKKQIKINEFQSYPGRL